MSDESASALRTRLGNVGDWYQYPVLLVLFGYMLWVRIISRSRFYVDGQVLYNGNDAWYHLRQVQYTVRNWPATMPFDPWTQFPYGTAAQQFGTIFDQLVATAALVIGLGSPSDQLVREVLLYTPAVFGALIIVPTYLVGKRLGGRPGGVAAALVLAVLPGQFLFRGLIGFSDHNIAEPFFQTFAVLGLMLAIRAGERDRVIYEQFADRDWAGVRETVIWSVVAGVAMTLYVWMWPPAVLLIGIAGVFFAIKIAVDYVRGTPTDHLASVAVLSMGTTTVLTLLNISTLGFSATDYSLAQSGSAFLIAVGAAFMVWLARRWDANDLDRSLYPVSILGIGLGGVTALWLAAPRVLDFFLGNLTRFVGFSSGAATRTIQEAQPFLRGQSFFDAVFGYYGFAFFSAALGLFILFVRMRSQERAGEYLFVAVWTLFITAAAFTQIRFNYYLAVPVAVLQAPVVGMLVDRHLAGFGLGEVRELADVTGAQIMVLLLVFVVVVAPLAVGVGGAGGGPSVASPSEVGNGTAPSPGYLSWQGSLEWLDQNTPEPGTLDGAENAEDLPYYGTFAQQDDFEYPEGAYGVMSWWDYGHWITYTGERIPNANPFQQGATTAANFLLSQEEGASLEVLESVSEDDAPTRYVMIDHQMAIPSGSSKYAAPLQFQSRNDSWSLADFYQGWYTFSSQQERYRFAGFIKNQQYWDSTVTRLFRYHGSAVEPSRTVYQWVRQGQLLQGSSLPVKLAPQSGNATRTFGSTAAARAFAAETPNSQVGGLRAPSEYVPALEHYRLVHASASTVPRSVLLRELFRDPVGQNFAFTKTFERVPGATVTVEGPANATVTASVTMNQTTRGAPFEYVQRAETGADGVAEFTLPYSTTGYENYGPENGHTNVSVRADTPYTFTTGNRTTAGGETVVFNATSEVGEAAVLGEAEGPGTVTLTEAPVPTGGNGTENGTETNTSAAALSREASPGEPATDTDTGPGLTLDRLPGTGMTALDRTPVGPAARTPATMATPITTTAAPGITLA